MTDPLICEQAASLYYTDRDGSYPTPRPVFVVRMRSVYYIVEPALHQKSGSPRRAIYSIVTDSTLTTIFTHEQSR